MVRTPDHGKDLVLLQASHVGYDPDTGEFGVYPRLYTEHGSKSRSCGKIAHIVECYAAEYRYALESVPCSVTTAGRRC